MQLDLESKKVIHIPTTLDSSLFKYWFQFLEPLHHLTEREMQVAGEYVYMRYRIMKKLKCDGTKADMLLQKEEVREEVRKAADVTPAHYQVILGKMRKAGVLDGNALKPKFMPKIVESEGMFVLILAFDFRKPE